MNEQNFSVRHFEPADQEEIRRLYRDTVAANPALYYRPLSGPQLPDNVADTFSHPNDAFFVAVAEGRIIGFCGLRTTPEDRTVASFVNGTIVPEFRGQGVYRELFRIRELEATRNGIKIFLAVTSHNNPKMKDFLIKNGFEFYEPEKAIEGFWHLKKQSPGLE